MTQPKDLSDALQRYKQHFGHPVSGRSIYEYPSAELVQRIERAIAKNEADPQLAGAQTDLVADAQPAPTDAPETEAEGMRAEALRRSQVRRALTAPRGQTRGSSK